MTSSNPNRRDLARSAVVMAAGAVGAAASVQSAKGSDDLELGPGEHVIDADLVVRGTLTLRPGAKIMLSANVRLTVMGDFIAPAVTVLIGKGLVDLTSSRVIAARAEWWGAIPGDAGTDCIPAIEAALAAHPFVQLGPGDYYLRRTLKVELHNRRLWGVGRSNGAHGTRLVVAGGDSAVIQVGSTSAPATINDYLRGVDIRWIELGRSTAPHDGSGDGAIGLMVRHVLDCVFEGLRANEHRIAFSLRGAVRTLVIDCAGFRSLFPGKADDTFVGFDLDGTRPAIETGGNASLYLIDCSVRTGNRPFVEGAIGCRLTGAFSDTFLVRFETTQLGYGIVVDGHPEGMPALRSRYAQLDLHIDTPVLDQCGRAGIALYRLGETAMIDIASCWVSVTRGAEAALSISNTGGAIDVIGGQMVATGGGDSTGVRITKATGVGMTGVKMLDLTRPVVAQGLTGFDLAPVVLAGTRLHDAVAVTLADCTDGFVHARLLRPSPFAIGVTLDAGCRAVTVDTAGLGATMVRSATATSGTDARVVIP